MFPQFVLRAGVGLAAVSVALRLPAAPAAAVDTNALLKELQQIETRQQQATHARLGGLAQRFLEASRADASTERVFLEAIRNISFESKAGDSGRFQDWRKNHKGMLENKAFQAAMRLNLRYVAISLQVAASPDQPPPFREVMAYLRDLQAARAEFGGNGGLRNDEEQQMLKDLYGKPIAEGLLAQGFILGPDLQRLTSAETSKWEPTAGGWRQILEIGVRQPLRAVKDPSLLETWQFEIDAGKKGLEGNRAEVANVNFAQLELPRLLWGQAQDMLVLGQQANAVAAMTRVIRTYPQHPDVIIWIGQLRGLLKPAATAS